jgi:hypothetical protein
MGHWHDAEFGQIRSNAEPILGTFPPLWRFLGTRPKDNTGETIMADGSNGASGILGVLVGVMLVLFIGAAILMYNGKIGNNAPSFTIKMPSAG